MTATKKDILLMKKDLLPENQILYYTLDDIKNLHFSFRFSYFFNENFFENWIIPEWAKRRYKEARKYDF